MHLLEALQWRYATKRMTGEKLPQEKVDNILEAIRLAPTADGIQPFIILHITDKQLLENIKPIANNQAQITEASHLLVFAAWDDITPERIDAVFGRVATERNLEAGALTNYTDKLKTRFAGYTPERRAQWAVRQMYITLGIAVAAAALEKVDATPMEGFRNADLDQLLGLSQKGLRSYALLALGYRDTANDKLVHLKKVRRPKDELIINL
jgi:nitroreductase/dihydropteridine reductase